MFRDNSTKKVGTIIKRWLFIVIFAAFVISIAGIIAVQSFYQQLYAFSLIEEGVKDVSEDVDQTFSDLLYDYTHDFTELIEDNKSYIKDPAWLSDLVDMNSAFVSEINIVDNQGFITNSSMPEYVGWDMNSAEQSAEFMCLLNGREYYEQDMRGNAYNESIQMVYAGMRFSDGSGFLQLGISKENYIRYLQDTLASEVRNRRIGVKGMYVIVDSDHRIIGSTDDAVNGHTVVRTEILANREGEFRRSRINLFDQDCYVVSTLKNGYNFVGGFPVSEAGHFGRIDKILIITVNILMLLCIFGILSRLLNTHVVKGIEDINDSLTKITGGDLDEKAEVTNSLEFTELSRGINSTVDRLKQMIAEADARIDEELAMANNIQQASLPDCSREFRENERFSLYASMETAKTVGGDFYDFYKLSDDLLAVTIADVSDKGIPAAMFMMRAKAVMKRLAEEGRSVEDMAAAANRELWENNEGSMFVTVWTGILDLRTGVMRYVHAGHTCPVLFGIDDPLFVKQKRDLMLGAMPEVTYHAQEIRLRHGETLFLYTDGVTEAEEAGGSLYGNERLESLLAAKDIELKKDGAKEYCREICDAVISDVHEYSGDVPQSDDITVLCLKYR